MKSNFRTRLISRRLWSVSNATQVLLGLAPAWSCGDRSKYSPHQGPRECSRRVFQASAQARYTYRRFGAYEEDRSG